MHFDGITNNVITDTKSSKVILKIMEQSGRKLFMGKGKPKSNNENLSFDDDQLGENKNNNGGGKQTTSGKGKK